MTLSTKIQVEKMTQVESISDDWLQLSQVEKDRLTGNTSFESFHSVGIIQATIVVVKIKLFKPDKVVIGDSIDHTEHADFDEDTLRVDVNQVGHDFCQAAFKLT